MAVDCHNTRMNIDVELHVERHEACSNRSVQEIYRGPPWEISMRLRQTIPMARRIQITIKGMELMMN